MATHRICSIDGCGKPHQARGWCSAHHARWRRHGSPEGRGTRTPRGEPLSFLLSAIESAKPDACILWPYTRVGLGYGRVRHNGSMQLAHRLVCEMVHGAPPSPTHHAAHRCGVHACISKHHLRWLTNSANEADKVLHGLSNRGERASTAKLTREQVHSIRKAYDDGQELTAEIGSRFGVNQSTVSQIGLRNKWKWLPEL